MEFRLVMRQCRNAFALYSARQCCRSDHFELHVVLLLNGCCFKPDRRWRPSQVADQRGRGDRSVNRCELADGLAGLGELIDLARIRVAGKQDQFMATGLRERVDGVAEGAGSGERFSDGLVGSGAREPVVVAQVSAGNGLGSRAEREAGAGQKPSRPVAFHVSMARAAPSRKGGEAENARNPAGAVAGDPAERGRGKPPNNNRGPPGVAGFGPISTMGSRQMVVTRSSSWSRSARRRR